MDYSAEVELKSAVPTFSANKTETISFRSSSEQADGGAFIISLSQDTGEGTPSQRMMGIMARSPTDRPEACSVPAPGLWD